MHARFFINQSFCLQQFSEVKANSYFALDVARARHPSQNQKQCDLDFP